MIDPISTFIFTSTGIFVIWMTKGFKGTFEQEMVSVKQRNSTKGTVAWFLGLGVWILVLVIVASLLT